jgi:hypothetical protein
MFYASLPPIVTGTGSTDHDEGPSQAFSPQAGSRLEHSISEFEAPKLELSSVAPDQRFECEQALDRYAGATLTAQKASFVLNYLRASVESRGLTVRSEYAVAAGRIVQRIEAARGQLDHRQCGVASEALRIAEFEASRLLKTLGQ